MTWDMPQELGTWYTADASHIDKQRLETTLVSSQSPVWHLTSPPVPQGAGVGCTVAMEVMVENPFSLRCHLAGPPTSHALLAPQRSLAPQLSISSRTVGSADMPWALQTHSRTCPAVCAWERMQQNFRPGAPPRCCQRQVSITPRLCQLQPHGGLCSHALGSADPQLHVSSCVRMGAHDCVSLHGGGGADCRGKGVEQNLNTALG